MPNLRFRLGAAVRRLRTEADYSQEAFALAVGVHRTYMGLIERGKVSVTLSTIEKLAKALRLSPSQLFLIAERERASAVRRRTVRPAKRGR